MQQHHLFTQKLEQHLVVSVLLCGIELLDALGMWFTTMVQAPHFTLIGIQYFPIDECLQGCRRAMAFVHQFLAGNLCNVRSTACLLPDAIGIARQRKEVDKNLLLFLGASQHVEGYVQCLFVAIGLAKAHISLSFRPVAFLVLQSGRQGCIHHLAQRSHVVIADPLPQLQLPGQQDGAVVEHFEHVAHLEAGCLVVQSDGNGRIAFRPAQRHQQAHTFLHPWSQFRADAIGERPVEGQGQYHVDISHTTAKIHKKKQMHTLCICFLQVTGCNSRESAENDGCRSEKPCGTNLP